MLSEAGLVCGGVEAGTREGGGDEQHFMPSLRSMYLPLGLYPLETAGGTLQHACTMSITVSPIPSYNPYLTMSLLSLHCRLIPSCKGNCLISDYN